MPKEAKIRQGSAEEQHEQRQRGKNQHPRYRELQARNETRKIDKGHRRLES